MNSIETAVAVGKMVLDVEHDHFVEAGIDNREHIPRVLRILASVAQVLRETPSLSSSADEVEDTLLAHGKERFMAEWMSQTEPDEDAQRVHEQGSYEFDRIACS